MLSLFDTSSDTAGFRLQYMEVYNWGTFDKKVFRINPQGNNSLMTGANASGKSTYIDALLTLMVPLKHKRFYNQSSGLEKKGDRTEKSYVLGYYGNIQEEGKSSVSTQMLRNTNTYSVILASFSNTNKKQITLFQVRWFSNNELKKQFGIAHIPLEIEKDFAEFDSKWNWKKRLEKAYNSNSSKNKIEFMNGPTAYAERITKLFGMRSPKALSLFNQIIGVKVLDDLDDFIRSNMLEEKNPEEKFLELKNNYLTLMDAKNNIEKAKEQITQLKPINDCAIQLNEIQEELEQLEISRDKSVYWFAKKGLELGSKELEKENETLQKLKKEATELDNQKKELEQQHSDLKLEMRLDTVGNQIDRLKQEILRLGRIKKEKLEKHNKYNETAQILNLIKDPSSQDFIENKNKAKDLKENTKEKIKAENENLRSLKNLSDKLEKDGEDLVERIQVSQKNKNNIPKTEARIREELISHIGANKEEIPFIGELIKVKDSELNKWENSIEKVLHNFALRLIVPQKYYSQVNKYVNNNNLRGRIRYDKYEENKLRNFKTQEKINNNSLIKKIEIKSDIEYKEWIQDYLEAQFNFSCVDSLREFEHFSEMAITQNGLIKYKRGKHEKDDRKYINRRENFVLGWDNKEKLKTLRQELLKIQEEFNKNKNSISLLEKEIKNLNVYKDHCHDLFVAYNDYDDINWQKYANEIQEKTEQKKKLEESNDKLKELQRQLEKIEKDLEILSTDIDDKKEEIYKVKQDIKNINQMCEENKNILNNLGEIDTAEFEEHNKNLLNLLYENFEAGRKTFQENNDKKMSQLHKEQERKEREASRKIQEFKNPPETITSRFSDWYSDVNNLPDSSNLEFINEYQKYLEKLEKDNLPKFEKKFNEILRENIEIKVGDFRTFFEEWSKDIKENIQHLNNSLIGIDFKHKPKTYIQLVCATKYNTEIQEFKDLLYKTTANVRELNSSLDARKYHFETNIVPLFEKLDKEDWRKKVMDVRSWFSYKAEEFYKEGQQKFKTYENMGQLSGGEKAQLTYTILGSAIAYQFGLTKDGMQSNSFRFIAIDEAFKAQDEDKARYLVTLCKQLHLQLLVVTPSDNIHIVENDISFVHFVERKNERHSWLYDMPIQEFKEEKEKYLSDD